MKTVTQDMPERQFKIPAGIVAEHIDPTTGLRATDSCPYLINEIFIRGTEPQAFCQEHRRRFFAFLHPEPFRREQYRRDSWERPRPTAQSKGRGPGFWKKLKRIFRF